MTAPAYAWARDVPRTASVARRAVAFGVDATIVFGLAWTLTFVLAALGVLRIPDVSLLGAPSTVGGLLWIVSIFEGPLLLAYFSILEGATGRTPGKMLAGLRVVRADGRPLDAFRAFVRNLLRLLWVTPAALVFVLVDGWMLHRTELDQRLGDLAAGTLVVMDRP